MARLHSVPKEAPATAVLNHSVAATIHCRLLRPLPAPVDVFAVLGTNGNPDDTDESVGEAHEACEVLRPHVSRSESHFRLRACKVVTRREHFTTGLTKYQVSKSMFLLMHKHQIAAQMIAKEPRAYTHIISTRPDLAVLRPIPSLLSSEMDFGTAASPIIYFPDWQHCVLGNEDWMLIGRAAPMLSVLNRLDHFRELNATWSDRSKLHALMLQRGPGACDVGMGHTPSGCSIRNSEGYLKLFAHAYLKLSLRPHPGVAGCLVRGWEDSRFRTWTSTVGSEANRRPAVGNFN